MIREFECQTLFLTFLCAEYDSVNIDRYQRSSTFLFHQKIVHRRSDFCVPKVYSKVSGFLYYCPAGVLTQSDDTMLKNYLGKGYRLVFSFVHGDGTSTHWSDVLRQCIALYYICDYHHTVCGKSLEGENLHGLVTITQKLF